MSDLQGLAVAAVSDWMVANIDGFASPFEFSILSGGVSNLTYRVRDANGAISILRTAPMGQKTAGAAHDMRREWAYLVALADQEVPTPAPLAYCEDINVTGSSFYVMESIDGQVLHTANAAEFLNIDARGVLSTSIVDALVDLHKIDIDDIDLGPFTKARRPRGNGYVDRQINTWSRQIEEWKTPHFRDILEIGDRLLANVPDSRSTIVHGDYRLGNVSVDPQGTVLAIFDWELATVGDPLTDLAWLTASWSRPGQEFPPTFAGPTADSGFADVEVLVKRYASRTGLDLSNFAFYEAFARWRATCTTSSVIHRLENEPASADKNRALDEYCRIVVEQSTASASLVSRL